MERYVGGGGRYPGWRCNDAGRAGRGTGAECLGSGSVLVLVVIQKKCRIRLKDQPSGTGPNARERRGYPMSYHTLLTVSRNRTL